MSLKKDKIIKIGLLIFLFVFYGSFLTHQINLVTADLGRHVINGKVFLQTHTIPTTNFYSYTEPDFSVVNHHWLSGVVFFLAWRWFGFAGLQMFFILLSILSFGLVLWPARRRVGLPLAALISIGAVFLLGERTEIRPEIFSYVFVGIFYFVLDSHASGLVRKRWLWALPIAEVFWVNTHIYFFLGPLVILAFLFQEIWQKKTFLTVIKSSLGGIFALSVLAVFANPQGWHAVLEPFKIFQNYGYSVLENQHLWFIERLIFDPNFLIFKIVFGLLLVSYILGILRARQKISVAHLCLALGVSVMAWLQIRNFALFGLLALPIIADNLRLTFGDRLIVVGEKLARPILTIFAAILILVFSNNLNRYFPYWRQFGLGLEVKNTGAAEFMIQNNIKGPIFNDYDVGGYLIFYLYPKEKVFVDNRPEAYPVDFFKKIYIPAQENQAVWDRLNDRYGFNVILFNYRDATPWAQDFLVKRIQDPQWAPVFTDQYVIIFLKRNGQNQSLIAAHELPKSNFQIRKNK